MADSGMGSAPPGKRILFKKTIKARTTKKGPSDALELFEHSKTSYGRIVEEKRRRLETERKSKELAEQTRRQAAVADGNGDDTRREKSHDITIRPPNVDLGDPSSPSSLPRKRKSDTFDDSDRSDDKYGNNTNPTPKVPHVIGAPPPGSTPSRGLRCSPPKPFLIADSDDSDNAFLPSPTTLRPSKTPFGKPRQDGHYPPSATPVISLGDNQYDDYLEVLTTKPIEGKQEEKQPKQDLLADMDPDHRRFIEQAKKRREESKANSNPGIIRAFVLSKIPNTSELVAQLRLNQEMKVLKDTWAFKNNVDANIIFLTWRGNRIYDFTNCQALKIKATDDKRAQPEDPGAYHRYHGEGFKEGAVLFEAWTEELFEEIELQKEEERRKLHGEFSDRDFFPEGMLEHQKSPVPKIRILLAAKTGEPVKISVRLETTVKELVASFRTSRKLGNDTGIYINFDGENLLDDQTVGQLGIEDKDVLDVIVR